MPKRTVAAISITAVLISILYAVSSFAGAQQECPSPTLIDTITGNGDQDSAPFDTTTNSFRISYQTTAERDTSPFILNVESADSSESIGPTAGVHRDGSASGESFANVPPGRYFIHILTTPGTHYTVTVEECGEGGQATPGEGTSGSAASTSPKSSTQGTQGKSKTAPVQPAPPAQPKATPPPVPQPPPSPGPLLNAGGPKDGPVPRMPDGGCPRHFPAMSENACYRR